MKTYKIVIALAIQALLTCSLFTSCSSGGEELEFAKASLTPEIQNKAKLEGTADGKNLKKFAKDLFPGVKIPTEIDIKGFEMSVDDDKDHNIWCFVFTKNGVPVLSKEFPAKSFKLSKIFGKEAWANIEAELAQSKK